MAVASAGPYASMHHCSRLITMPASHHSVFAGRMPFLSPNQQRQSTEATFDRVIQKIKRWTFLWHSVVVVVVIVVLHSSVDVIGLNVYCALVPLYCFADSVFIIISVVVLCIFTCFTTGCQCAVWLWWQQARIGEAVYIWSELWQTTSRVSSWSRPDTCTAADWEETRPASQSLSISCKADAMDHRKWKELIKDVYIGHNLPSVLWHCWLGGRKCIRPVKTERWGAGMVICLERCADLHMSQLMPLPLTVSCFSKIQIGFTFLVPAHPGSPGQRAIKRVCVYIGHNCRVSVTECFFWNRIAWLVLDKAPLNGLCCSVLISLGLNFWTDRSFIDFY